MQAWLFQEISECRCVTNKQKEIGYTKIPFWVAMHLAKINKIHRYFGSGKYFFKKDIDTETLKFL